MLSKYNLRKIRNLIFRRGYSLKKWKKKFKYYGESSNIEYPCILQNANLTSIGNQTTILSNARLQNYTDKVPNIEGIYIGDNCYIGSYCSILNGAKITIGNNVLIASNVLISSENHGINPESDIPYMDQELTFKDVTIEDGVWIGQNVSILPGVTIGTKSIIGAGSVVTKSVPEYCIAAGIPAKIIKKYNFTSHKWEKI